MGFFNREAVHSVERAENKAVEVEVKLGQIAAKTDPLRMMIERLHSDEMDTRERRASIRGREI